VDGAARVDRAPRAEFDAGAMPQPSHIYASTLHRRDRRRRRRGRRPLALPWLAAIAAALAVVVL
jgi:hypothetical protein